MIEIEELEKMSDQEFMDYFEAKEDLLQYLEKRVLKIVAKMLNMEDK